MAHEVNGFKNAGNVFVFIFALLPLIGIIAFFVVLIELWVGDLKLAAIAAVLYILGRVATFIMVKTAVDAGSFVRLGSRILLGYGVFAHDLLLIALAVLMIIFFASKKRPSATHTLNSVPQEDTGKEASNPFTEK